MGVKCNGKPVYQLRYNAAIEDSAALGNVWVPMNQWRENSNEVMFLMDKTKVNNLVKSCRVTLQPKQTLFFGKTSEFPRFKLSESDFKRCIKIEKADAVVVGGINCTPESYMAVLEDEVAVYVINDYRINNVRARDPHKHRAWTNDWFKYIQDNKLFYGNEIKQVYKGQVVFFSRNSALDMEKIIDKTYTKLVTDEDVDSMINKNLDIITKEDLEAICDMLDSPDRTTQGVGLKMLCGYNVNETVLSVRTMLGTRPYLMSCPEWKGVGVQQVLNTIKWAGFGYFPLSMDRVVQQYDKTQTYSDYDKNLCKEVYIIAARQYMESAIKQITDSGILSNFGVKVTYEIK